MAASTRKSFITEGFTQKHKFAEIFASAVTLACAVLLAHLGLRLFCWLALAGAVLRECNAPTAATSARANCATSCGDVQTGHRIGECHFRLVGSSAQHSSRSLLHGVTISLQLLPAVVNGREHAKLSGGPGADATALRCPKTDWRRPSHTGQRRGRATTSRSSDRLQCASLLRWDATATAQDPGTLPLLHRCRRHCIRIQISFDNLG